MVKIVLLFDQQRTVHLLFLYILTMENSKTTTWNMYNRENIQTKTGTALSMARPKRCHIVIWMKRSSYACKQHVVTVSTVSTVWRCSSSNSVSIHARWTKTRLANGNLEHQKNDRILNESYPLLEVKQNERLNRRKTIGKRRQKKRIATCSLELPVFLSSKMIS